jgi:hypothetical protein
MRARAFRSTPGRWEPSDLMASCARYHDLIIVGLKSLSSMTLSVIHTTLVRLVAEEAAAIGRLC